VWSRRRYDPYGETRYTYGRSPTDFGFTAQREDGGTGLMYYRARYYHPALGRFVSADAIVPNPQNPVDFNRYAYVRNSPLNYIDNNGHVPIIPVLLIGGVLLLSGCTNLPPATVDIGSGTTNEEKQQFANSLQTQLVEDDYSLSDVPYFSEDLLLAPQSTASLLESDVPQVRFWVDEGRASFRTMGRGRTPFIIMDYQFVLGPSELALPTLAHELYHAKLYYDGKTSSSLDEELNAHFIMATVWEQVKDNHNLEYNSMPSRWHQGVYFDYEGWLSLMKAYNGGTIDKEQLYQQLRRHGYTDPETP